MSSEIINKLKEIKLSGMADEYESIAENQDDTYLKFDDLILRLIEAEASKRQRNSIQNQLKLAGFSYIKELADYDYSFGSITHERIESVRSTFLLNPVKNVVFLGSTGTGKTHLSIGLGLAAVRAGKKVRFFDAVDLCNKLVLHSINRTIERFETQLTKVDLVIIDEMGYIPFPNSSGSLLFHLLNKLDSITSIMITTNLVFSRWGEIFGDQMMTNAMLDRLTQKCEIIQTGEESYRFKNRIKG